jgi:hypothetical protein
MISTKNILDITAPIIKLNGQTDFYSKNEVQAIFNELCSKNKLIAPTYG